MYETASEKMLQHIGDTDTFRDVDEGLCSASSSMLQKCDDGAAWRLDSSGWRDARRDHEVKKPYRTASEKFLQLTEDTDTFRDVDEGLCSASSSMLQKCDNGAAWRLDSRGWRAARQEHEDVSDGEFLLCDDQVARCGMRYFKTLPHENIIDLSKLEIKLNTSASEKELAKNCTDLGRLFTLKSLCIAHASNKEILALSLFKNSFSSLRSLLIVGPQIGLKLSEESVHLIRDMSNIRNISLCNLQISHNAIGELLKTIKRIKYLETIDMSNVMCADNNRHCDGFHLHLTKNSFFVQTVNISVGNILQFTCPIANRLIEPIMPYSLTRLSLHFAEHHFPKHIFITSMFQMLILLADRASLDVLELEGMKVGEKEIPNVTFHQDEIHQLASYKYDQADCTIFCTKLIRGHLPFVNTKFDMRDFRREYSTADSFADSVILNLVCYQLAEEFPDDIEEVFASLINSKDEVPTLICILEKDIAEDLFRLFQLKKILKYHISKAAIKAENAIDKDSEEYKLVVENSFNDLNTTLRYHAENLMISHTNIEALRVSFVKIKNLDEAEICPCIVIYCKIKAVIPYKEEQFPKELEHPFMPIKFQTDVREGYYLSCPLLTCNGKDWNKELAMGCSIGELNANVGATIGPFVNVVETGETCFLTVRHMFQPYSRQDTNVLGSVVVQPSDVYIPQNLATFNKECGKVISCQLGGQIDAALVEISKDRLPTRGNFVDFDGPDLQFAGFSSGEIPTFDDGSRIDAKCLSISNRASRRIIKVGSRTGLTKGTLSTTDGAVRETVKYWTMERRFNGRTDKYEIMSQIFVDSYTKNVFCQEGDSGAAVFLVDDDNKLYCIGMVIGVLSDFTSVVTPIQNILDILGHKCGKKLELKKFQFAQMET